MKSATFRNSDPVSRLNKQPFQHLHHQKRSTACKLAAQRGLPFQRCRDGPNRLVAAASPQEKLEQLQKNAQDQADDALDDFEDSLESQPTEEVLEHLVGVHGYGLTLQSSAWLDGQASAGTSCAGRVS